MNKCHNCNNSEIAIGSGHHIFCKNPDREMTANPHGIRNGWCFYPFNFDPIWLTKQCSNYSDKEITNDSRTVIKEN